MLRKLLGARKSAPPIHLPCATSAGVRIYAIGDIHGRLDLLERLIDRICADNGSRAAADTTLIFLGDLIDRGPHSAQVVDRLIALRDSGIRCRFLLGNHEEVFLSSLAGDLRSLKFFIKIGGKPTILSYGISEEEYRELSFEELSEKFQALVPKSHYEFIASFEDMIVEGDYCFVHAGVRPKISLLEQKPSDLRWIRNEFIEHDGAFDKMIVHGHTIFDDVQELTNRISLDTGAFSSGKLSAMGFEAENRWIIDTL